VRGAAPGCDIFAQRFALTPGVDCAGDLNGDGEVTIDELVFAVGVALSDQSGGIEGSRSCLATEFYPAIDTDLDCHITIADLLTAVSSALDGCQ
jgi:hypothetical protein